MLTRLQQSEIQDSISIKPFSEVLTQTHKAKSRSEFVHFDIDMPFHRESSDSKVPKCQLSLEEIYKEAVRLVGHDAVSLIETRGGCHLLVKPNKVISQYENWHSNITEAFDVDQTGDLMLPVVGCCQGNFTPSFFS